MPVNLFRYRAYQLDILSEFALPELCRPAGGLARGEVHVRWHRFEDDGRPVTEPGARHAGVDEAGRFRLELPGIGRYAIGDGREILVEPAPGADAESLRLYLLGSALGALLMQQGLLVLHGNAVRVGDRCMLCLGASGAGKSTLAAAFQRRGHAVLADDVVALDAGGQALPGIPRLKLWGETARQLSIDVARLPRVRPGLEKYGVPVEPVDEALPVRWIYLLSPDEGDGIRLRPLRGMQCYAPLLAHTYRAAFLDPLGLRARHLEQCGRLAGHVRCVEAARARRGFDLDGLVDALQADMEAHP